MSPALEDILAVGATPVSTATLAQRCRAYFEERPQLDRLSAQATAGATSVTVNQPTIWSEGDRMEPDDSTGVVWVVGPTGVAGNTVYAVNPINVMLLDASPDVTHAINTVVRKNPVYSTAMVLSAIERILPTLFPEVYVVKATTVVPSTTTTIFPAPVDLIDLVAVTQPSTSSQPQTVAYGGKRGRMPVLIQEGLEVGDAPSTRSIQFPAGFYNQTEAVTVYYRAEVTASFIPDDDIATLIQYGVLAEVLAGKEIRYWTVSKGPAETNQSPGGMLRQGAYWDLRFTRLKGQIRSRLWRIAPPMRKWVS